MKKFKKVYIEITNVCNLSCSFCPQTQRTSRFMKVEEFEAVLEEVKPYTDHVYLHVKGEPLLHPNIDSLLKLCGEKGLNVNITTNGTLISKVKEKLLDKPAVRQINFSLHSFDANEKSINMDEYLYDILSFAKEAVENTNMIIALRFWNLSEDNITNLQKQKNRHMLSVIEQFFNLDFKIQEKISDSRGVKIDDRLFLNQDFEFKWPGLKEEEVGSEGYCYALKNQIAILADGTVVPCCLDGEGVIKLGNIFETPFRDILEGERTKNISEGFAKREAREELCRRCGYRTRFGK